MKKVMLSLTSVLLLSLLVVTPALATPPDNASGQGEQLWRDDTTAGFLMTGTFEGEGIEYFGPGKSSRFVCDCTVDGKKGMIVFNLVQLNYKTMIGHFTSLSATGDLEGLHFQGKFDGSGDVVIYWGKIHFDPQ